jgi:hypothetical protein
MAGAVGNGSGRDVEYEVEPSDPGGNFTGDTQIALYSTVAGGLSLAAGCVGGVGGRGVVYLGLGLLALALVFQVRALRRLRVLERQAAPLMAAPQAESGGKTDLGDGQEHPRTFVAGTSWVVFYSDDPPFEPLAVSPKISDPNARVVLRRCGTPSTLAGGELAKATDGYYVEV